MVRDETLAEIDASVVTSNIPSIRVMTGSQLKEVSTRYDVSKAALAIITGMLVESTSKWEGKQSKPDADH